MYKKNRWSPDLTSTVDEPLTKNLNSYCFALKFNNIWQRHWHCFGEENFFTISYYFFIIALSQDLILTIDNFHFLKLVYDFSVKLFWSFRTSFTSFVVTIECSFHSIFTLLLIALRQDQIIFWFVNILILIDCQFIQFIPKGRLIYAENGHITIKKYFANTMRCVTAIVMDPLTKNLHAKYKN